MPSLALRVRHLCLLLALTGWATAESPAATLPGGFVQVDLEGGGWFSGVVQHSGGRLYGRTDVGGSYRSDDFGEHWTFLGGNFTSIAGLSVQGMAVRPSDANTVLQTAGTSYTATEAERGIWKSVNAGATWTQVLSGVNFSGNDAARWGGECILFHPTIDTEAWAGSRAGGLWKSTNAGDTWTQQAAATFGSVVICGVMIAPAFPDQIFVAGEGGLWVSTDHGGAWTKLKTYDQVWRVARKADGTTFFSAQQAGSNVLQRIQATNWANPATYTYTDLRPAYFTGAAYSHTEEMPCLTLLNDGRLISGALFQFTRISANNGASFTTLARTLTAGKPVPKWSQQNQILLANCLVQDATNPQRWFGASGYGPLRTEDGGATWHYILEGIGEVVAWEPEFHPTDPERIYLPIADHGAAIITDGGASGKAATMMTPAFPYPDDTVMFSHVALPGANSSRVICPGGEQGTHRVRLYATSNDGTAWSKLAGTGLPTGNNREIIQAVAALDNPDDFLVLCGGNSGTGAGGVYRTLNGGSTFTQATGLPAGAAFGDEFYWDAWLERDGVDASKRYFYLRNGLAAQVGLYRSTDRGASWTRIGTPGQSTYVTIGADRALGGALWAAGNGAGLEKSLNSGTSWSVVAGFISADYVDACNGRVAVIGRRTGDTFNKVYYSANAGGTWDEITRPGYRFGNASTVTVDPHRPGRVWIAHNGRSLTRFTPGTAIEQWRLQQFRVAADSGSAANLADPDGDGLFNLLEYGLGTDPRPGSGPASGRARLPTGSIATSNPLLTGRLTLHLTLPDPAPADLTLTVEASSDLQNAWAPLATRVGNGAWTWVATGPSRVVPGAVANGRSELDMGDVETSATQRFLRLRVTGP